LGTVRRVLPSGNALVELEDGTKHRISFSYIQSVTTREGAQPMNCEACRLTVDEIQALDHQRCKKTRSGLHRWRLGYESHVPKSRAG
jgi:hypothetical protein